MSVCFVKAGRARYGHAMQIHPLITDTPTLASLCTRLAQGEFVCVDTEFMRENTYWPQLCLVQIGNAEEAAAIDPLAPGLDLAPLLELLTDNEDVLKVFHAGGQDVEIIYNLTGRTPHPIFDTQVAMMAVSQSEQIGYAHLVETWLGIQVDKGARFTDWSARPLTERQITYAIGDVTHLATIFPKLLRKLMKTGRGAWLDVEMERLADPANYASTPEDAWKRLRLPGRNAAVLGRLKALAAWREREAQRKDLPRGRIMRDETLADIASHPPRAQADLAKVRGLSPAWRDNEIGRRLMAVLEAAQPLSREEMPPRARTGAPLGREGSLVADLLKLLLKIRSRELDVAARLLARSDELEQLAAGLRDLDLLNGWRRDVFGRDALALVEGQLGFTVRKGRLVMTRVEGEGTGADLLGGDETQDAVDAEPAEWADRADDAFDPPPFSEQDRAGVSVAP